MFRKRNVDDSGMASGCRMLHYRLLGENVRVWMGQLDAVRDADSGVYGRRCNLLAPGIMPVGAWEACVRPDALLPQPHATAEQSANRAAHAECTADRIGARQRHRRRTSGTDGHNATMHAAGGGRCVDRRTALLR